MQLIAFSLFDVWMCVDLLVGKNKLSVPLLWECVFVNVAHRLKGTVCLNMTSKNGMCV